MRSRARQWAGVLLAGALGCASDRIDVREYVLTPAAVPDAVAATGTEQRVALVIGPVIVPPYLRRREIVTRVGDNEVYASDTHLWAEDLGDGLARVVAEDLAVLIPDLRVSAFAWRGPSAADYRVAIDVERFEPMPDGTVALKVHWEILRAKDASPLAARGAEFSAERHGSGTAATVDAMSRAAAELSRQIADAIPGETSRPGNRFGT